MMKISVISSYSYVQHHNNYGALLQYYALQTYLKKRGHYTEWIRTKGSSVSEQTSFHTVYLKFRHPNRLISELKTFYYRCQFMLFINRFLNLTKENYNSIEELNQFPPISDYYITGSDQVWAGCSPKNFLTFVSDGNKKIAYAASFGEDKISDEKKTIIEPWLKSFKAISVRESSGVDICKSIGIKAVHLLDPTLLISPQEYPMVKRLREFKPYYFCYFLNVNTSKEIFFDKIKEYAYANIKDLKVVAIQGAEKCIDRKYRVNPTPEAWLTYVNNCKGVFTNSFHGTLFAILFHKPFVVILQKGETAIQNGRFRSILDIFELSNRIIDNPQNMNDIMNQPIDWVKVDRIRASWIQKSDDFFNSIGL